MNKKGFTLIEMLIVIVIIGILAAALIPKLTGVQGRARDVARKSDMQQIASTLATYNLDNGTYPASATETTDATGFANTLAGLVSANLMRSLPKEVGQPSVPYAYRTFNNDTTFTLKALSEGAGVNANYGSGSDFPSFTGTSNASTITQALCAKVENDAANPDYIPGGLCKTNVIGLNARYIIAN